MIKTKKIIDRFIAMHGLRYKYNKVIYVRLDEHVIITCRIHGDFLQTPHSHLKGSNCQKCAKDTFVNKIKMPSTLFFSLANKKHNNVYDYTKTVYLGSNEPIFYRCPKHGIIKQTAKGHLRYGCDKCGVNKRKMCFDEFINRGNSVHFNKFTYINDGYDGVKNKVKIICPIHGLFEQAGDDHLRGNGCRKCKRTNGENKIADILNKSFYDYFIEYKIPKYTYRYDFYIPKLNLLIEYDGIQHFKPIEFFGGEKGLKKVKKVDKIKNHLASKLGYELLRISYKNIAEIESMLNDKINSCNANT